MKRDNSQTNCDGPELVVTLEQVRVARRLSQRQLAMLVGVRPDTISALERGASAGIKFDTLAGICDILGCQPGDVLRVRTDGELLPVLGGPDEADIIGRRMEEAKMT